MTEHIEKKLPYTPTSVMTKAKVAQSDGKPTELEQPPHYTTVELPDHEGADPKAPSTTCWYVCGILSTIFCCLPCGVVGLVHAMIAKHEGERGNLLGYRRRMRQAKCWTSCSIILGFLAITALILYTVGATVGFSQAYEYWCGGVLSPPDDYYFWSNETMRNSTEFPLSKPRIIFN
ncbi:uncharacterized protein [Watersipora subatra]|uniref:uncharacterized protein n=1 Tax=Watersipora subatra TaxID=2589382 RepID=UPI00355B071C